MEIRDTRALWEHVLTQVELSVSPANFNTWFKGSMISKIDDGVVYIGVPSQFFKDWYLKKFHTLLLKILRSASDDVRNVEYVIVKDAAWRRDERPRQKRESQELPLAEHYVNKEDNLNPRYTFDSFVVGSFNQMAHTAAVAAVKQPGILYNPLFIYGDTGRGKTHLIQSIGNQYKKLYPNRKVFYLTSEKFAMEYQGAVAQGTANRFKEKYRQYDLIIMDDVQFLSGKEKTQEELFHLFNALYDNNKQLILSADKHPNFMTDLADRLRTRFLVGMTVDIAEPDTDSRIMILKKKAAMHGVVLPDETAEFIAKEVRGSIRELEGILTSIVCQVQVKDTIPDIQEIRSIIKANTRPQKSVSIKTVIERIAHFYNIDEASIYEKTRRREVVRPRQVIMYILREDFNVSYPSIGSKLGGRDHTTVIHSCEKIKTNILTDTVLAHEIEQIRAQLV